MNGSELNEFVNTDSSTYVDAKITIKNNLKSPPITQDNSDSQQIDIEKLEAMANCLVHKLKDYIEDDIPDNQRLEALSFLRDRRTYEIVRQFREETQAETGSTKSDDRTEERQEERKRDSKKSEL